MTAELAQVLEVSPQALAVPDIDSYIGLMHTLFTLEDIYGLTVSEVDGEGCLKLKASDTTPVKELRAMPNAWREQAAKLEAGEIDSEQYNRWRYNHLKYDTTQHWGKIPPQELSDALVEKFGKGV